jgi:hypothetical protein
MKSQRKKKEDRMEKKKNFASRGSGEEFKS